MCRLFKTFLSSECLYAVSNSAAVHKYEQREQVTIADVRKNILLSNSTWKDTFLACSYGVSNSGPAFQSEISCLTAVIIACSLCSYVCTDPELETAYEQAKITALIQNISLRRQGLDQRKVFKRESFHNVQFF